MLMTSVAKFKLKNLGSEGIHKLIWEHIMHMKVDLRGEHVWTCG
jgi:hypothetical protein